MNFRNPELGASGDDIQAALILKDAGKMGLLKKLHDRKIRVTHPVDEYTEFDELEFEPVRVGHE